jgi:hypothetical protein
MNERELAIAQLEALARVPGALRIITNQPDPAGTGQDDVDPAHWIMHDVVRLEGPNHRGQYTAHSLEGDWCQGQPEALLARLQQWRTEQGRRRGSA